MTTQTVLVRPNVGHFVALGLTQAEAQATSKAPSGGQRPTSKVIGLLIASSRETNPAKTLELLKQAREEVKKEQLAPDDLERVLNLISDLEKKATSRLELLKSRETSANSGGPTPNTPSATKTTSTKHLGTLPSVAHLESITGASVSTGEGFATKEIETTLAENPEIRDAMWEIGRSRLSRDAQNLDAIVQERTGQSPKQYDQAEAKMQAEAAAPGAFLEFAKSLGLLNLDVAKANAKLKQDYDGVSTDLLADQLIRDASKWTTFVSFTRGVINDYGSVLRFAGLTADVVVAFRINATLVLRLADLYGVEFDDSEKEVALLSVFALVKYGMQYGMNSQVTADLFRNFGTKLGALKYGKSPGAVATWLASVIQPPHLTNQAPSALAGWLSNFLKSKSVPTGAVATANAAAAEAAPAANVGPAPKPSLLRSIAYHRFFLVAVRAGLFGAQSFTETQAMGHVSKIIFRNAREMKRIVHNEDFRRFLMTPTAEGFTKLLVLSMNDGLPSNVLTANARTAAEMKDKATFIYNIARSARTCSPDDITKMMKSPEAAYACQANANVARFNRLKAEMLTYDEIPQGNVADLRTVSREHRLRMAELILQMQFLDGDRNPSETQFFRNVVTKVLGVDGVEDIRYFERLHAFIHDNGGMIRSNATPTGFTIRMNAAARPANVVGGYLPEGAPEAPPGAVYLEAKAAIISSPAAGSVAKPSVPPSTSKTSETTTKTTEKTTEKTTDTPAASSNAAKP